MRKLKKKRSRNIIIFIIVFSSILLFFAYRYYHDSTFVEKNMIEYTEIKKYIVTVNYYDNYQSYIEVLISIHDKNKLLKKYNFENSLKKLKGKIQPEFISEKDEFIYCVIQRAKLSYRYIIIALEKNGNILQVYEYYG